MQNSNKPLTVEEYINACPLEHRAALFELRARILEAMPNGKEKISWQMPTFTYNGHNIIHFALHAKHIGIYPGGECVEVFKNELTDYKTSKGAVQIPLTKPVPYNIIINFINFNLQNL
jgi:uncharacterized protein YdhG (YjbR/CyaY superfamily)